MFSIPPLTFKFFFFIFFIVTFNFDHLTCCGPTFTIVFNESARYGYINHIFIYLEKNQKKKKQYSEWSAWYLLS